ncbi:MAG: hypothetical protein H0U74_20150 [Bradymonadaceae bacterium]|nr:hypothetical protein [Lujinxingiaceae bacterium]
MIEWLELFVSTASYLQIVTKLAQMSATEVVLVFLVSKPVFVMVAIGAVLSGADRPEHCELLQDSGEQPLHRQ